MESWSVPWNDWRCYLCFHWSAISSAVKPKRRRWASENLWPCSDYRPVVWHRSRLILESLDSRKKKKTHEKWIQATFGRSLKCDSNQISTDTSRSGCSYQSIFCVEPNTTQQWRQIQSDGSTSGRLLLQCYGGQHSEVSLSLWTDTETNGLQHRQTCFIFLFVLLL